MEAVTSTEGFIRVIAGAGSGKTRALTHRFAFLVNEVGILPGNILCVTFTNKAADEMRQRIHLLTGDNDTGYICTFHSFCVSILQEDSFAVQYPKSFLVLDNSDIDDMLRIIYAERGLTLRDMAFRDARDMIEIQKLFKKPDYYLDMIEMSLDTLHDKYMQATETKEIIFYGYLYQEKKCSGLDYNDLIKFVLYIFSQNHEIKLKWQKRLEYIMIDEFQDIDFLQYELMENLCGYHKNLFIVGDPDQTIYTWRGADVKYLMEFDKVFPNVKTIMMTQNNRSTPQIIAAVNSLIDKNRYRVKKDLIPMLPDGESVLCHHAAKSEDEAKWIASQMFELNDSGVPFRDMTVLYRAHYITRTIEDVLRKAKMPYTIYSGVQFYERMEICLQLVYSDSCFNCMHTDITKATLLPLRVSADMLAPSFLMLFILCDVLSKGIMIPLRMEPAAARVFARSMICPYCTAASGSCRTSRSMSTGICLTLMSSAMFTLIPPTRITALITSVFQRKESTMLRSRWKRSSNG